MVAVKIEIITLCGFVYLQPEQRLSFLERHRTCQPGPVKVLYYSDLPPGLVRCLHTGLSVLHKEAGGHIRMGRYGFLQRCLQQFYAYRRRQLEQHSELVVAVCFAQTLTGEVNAELGLGERRNHYGVSFLISQLAFLPNPRPPRNSGIHRADRPYPATCLPGNGAFLQ